MIIEHNINFIQKEIECEKPQFILRNKKGDFLFFSILENISKYNGYFITTQFDKESNSWDMLKSIEKIELVDDKLNNKFDLKKIIKNKNGFIKEYECGASEEINFDNNINYTIKNFKGFIKIYLDTRRIYDFSTEGRIFKIYKYKERENILIIEYNKYSDNTLKNLNYKAYTIIKFIKLENLNFNEIQFDEINQWIKRDYNYDVSRGTKPFQSYVFHAINLKLKEDLQIKIITSNNLEDGIKEIDNQILKKQNNEKNLYEKNLIQIETIKKEKKYNKKELNNKEYNNENIKDEILIAYYSACNSINKSIVEIKDIGIYAGLPWFFQFWTRDEAISLYGAYLAGSKNEAKQILKKLINNISLDGRIPNRIPSSILGSADGVGWVFKRVSDFIKNNHSKNELNYFNEIEKSEIKKKLYESINKIELNYMEDGLITCKAKETWMDTEYKGDVREGKRIEIQALHLKMLETAKNLSSGKEKKKYEDKEKTMCEIVKNIFYKNEILADGKNDFTIRPNIFLTYYIYPQLLSQEEWEIVFDNSLNSLWCEWGGLSTIDKKSNLYCKKYTGENNISYHRGDSWYFVNNISAICLLKVNFEKYKSYIIKIIEASTRDILSIGAIGELSEISSSEIQEAQGCFGQAWSLATYIELINEFNITASR